MTLILEDIKKSFGDGENKTEVLKGISCEIKGGNICVLLGPSGSGKSTLLNIIGGIASHGKQSPKAVIKAYVNAVEKQSGKKMYKLIDKKIIKYIKDENDIDKEDMIEQLDDVMEYSGEALENQVGKVKSIKVKFKKVKKLKGSKLEDKKEDYEDEYDIKVSQVARVEATIKVKGKDDDVEEDITMYVYKRAGKWYLDFSSIY